MIRRGRSYKEDRRLSELAGSGKPLSRLRRQWIGQPTFLHCGTPQGLKRSKIVPLEAQRALGAIFCASTLLKIRG